MQARTKACVRCDQTHDGRGRGEPPPFCMSKARQFITSLGRQAAPITLGLVVGALCLYQARRERKYEHKNYREAFPFSHYPMYSGFDDFDYVVFIGKPGGTPLMIETVTQGYKANSLKKKFDDMIDDLKDEKGRSIRNRNATPEQMRPSGEKVLKWLAESYPSVAREVEAGGVALYQVRIQMTDRGVTESAPILIAQRPAGAAPSPK